MMSLTRHPELDSGSPEMLKRVQYHPIGVCEFDEMTDSQYPWFAAKAKELNDESVEAQFNSIGAAFQIDSSESDTEVGKGVWCFQEVSPVQPDKSCIGVDAWSTIAFDQSQ
jgi:hypothetical protein